MSNIKSVLDSKYNNPNVAQVIICDDGRVNLVINDPAGDPELTVSRSFDRKNEYCRSNLQYNNVDELIALIDREIAMAPRVRANIQEFMAV